MTNPQFRADIIAVTRTWNQDAFVTFPMDDEGNLQVYKDDKRWIQLNIKRNKPQQQLQQQPQQQQQQQQQQQPPTPEEWLAWNQDEMTPEWLRLLEEFLMYLKKESVAITDMLNTECPTTSTPIYIPVSKELEDHLTKPKFRNDQIQLCRSFNPLAFVIYPSERQVFWEGQDWVHLAVKRNIPKVR